MTKLKIKDLLEAGVHFGHQRKKWNPKMKPYIYCDKNGVSIINLDKTYELLGHACEFLKQQAANKKNIVLVGTKKNIAEIIKTEAIRCGVFYINRRWLGGLLTNFDTIRHRLNRLRELEDMQEAGTVSHANKKELSAFTKELEKLQKTLGGIKNMRGKPDILFVVDQQKEDIAIKEAIKTNTKLVVIIDTNCNPDGIDFPIPGNDDSIRSVKLITNAIADAILEGREGQVPNIHDANASKNNNINKKQTEQNVKLVQEITVPQEQGA